MSEQTKNHESEFIISRAFDAPRNLVWKAWNNADSLAEWWGPKDFKITVHKLKFAPGGELHYDMLAHNGFQMWGKFIFKEIKEPEKIIFINSFSNEKGEIARAPFFDGKWALEILNEVTFAEENGKTILTIKAKPINATKEEHQVFEGNKKSMEQGFGGTLDKLTQYLEKNK